MTDEMRPKKVENNPIKEIDKSSRQMVVLVLLLPYLGTGWSASYTCVCRLVTSTQGLVRYNSHRSYDRHVQPTATSAC